MRTVRASDKDVEILLNRLDNAQSDPRASKRRSERYPYRLKSCAITLQNPGTSSAATILVPTRDLSAGGISFLHGGFIHTGTRCIVQLISRHGTWQEVPGIIVETAYIENWIHEVRVKFDFEISPADFCSAAQITRILIAEDDKTIAMLAMKHLKDLNAEVDHVENGQLAVDLAKKNLYDCILMDIEMPVMDGYEAVKLLRKNGYSGAIIAVTAMTRPEDREKCLKIGFDQYIPKPYTPMGLQKLISTLDNEPLISDFQSDSSMVPMINEFIESMPAEIRVLEEVMLKENMEELELATRALKGRAGGFGYPTISDAAGVVESAIQSDSSQVKIIKNHLNELVHLCMQARGAPETQVKNAS